MASSVLAKPAITRLIAALLGTERAAMSAERATDADARG
jgi:hypothetical protein